MAIKGGSGEVSSKAPSEALIDSIYENKLSSRARYEAIRLSEALTESIHEIYRRLREGSFQRRFVPKDRYPNERFWENESPKERKTSEISRLAPYRVRRARSDVLHLR